MARVNTTFSPHQGQYHGSMVSFYGIHVGYNLFKGGDYTNPNLNYGSTKLGEDQISCHGFTKLGEDQISCSGLKRDQISSDRNLFLDRKEI